MKLHCYGSSSSGNMYTLTSGTGHTLVLDAGVNPKSLFKDIKPSMIDGVLVTHSHGDHAGYIKKFTEKFVDVYSPFKANNINILTDMQQVVIGEYKVIPMRMNHDVICFGYLINHKELYAPVLYATDTNGIPYIFDNLSLCIIEADYITSLIKENYRNGLIDRFRVSRVLKTHNSLEQAISFIKDNVSFVGEIVLTHLSVDNSKVDICKSAFLNLMNKDVYIGSAGLDIEVGASSIFGERKNII